MLRSLVARVVVACCAAVLPGCGASEEDRVAEAVAAYPRALAARDGEAACEALTRDARAQVGPRSRASLCGGSASD